MSRHNQTITLCSMQMKPIRFTEPNAYCLTPMRGWVPLQRLVFWFLQKIGCNFINTRDDIKCVTFNPKDTMDAILKAHHDLIDLAHVEKGEILIGGEDFNKFITQEADLLRPHTFIGPYAYGDGQGTRILDMKVTVIPWMKGVLVVPARREVGHG